MSKILIVDDSDFMKDVISDAIDLIGFGSDKASNGLEALEYVKKEKYELMVTDVNMPEMDGITLIGEVRKFNKDLPIIVLTTEADDSIKKNAINAGANSWITKPFEATQLLNLIKELTE